MFDINTGDIVLINTSGIQKLSDHRYTKYVVVVSDFKQWVFCINTENRILYDTIPISKNNHSFLKNAEHYISCNRYFEFPKENIIKKHGSLDKNELIQLLNKVQSSKTIPYKQKTLIISNIQEQINKF